MSRAAKSDEPSCLVETSTRLDFDLVGVVNQSGRGRANFSRARTHLYKILATGLNISNEF